MQNDLEATIQHWCAEETTSARSLLVTIFGDSILPATNSVWLSQLFELSTPFGFSERLVRTSLFRLVGEGWVVNERVGRRSRYRLTPLAIHESTDADRRIYFDDPPQWDGSWTLVFPERPSRPSEDRELLTKHLGWLGFLTFTKGLMASPTATPEAVRDLCDLINVDVPATATAKFDNLDDLVASGTFGDALNLMEIETAFSAFLDRYRTISPPTRPMSAFALRTMLIHDLRRVRLRMPETPAELLPPDWIGHAAFDLAASLYAKLSSASAEALSGILELDYPSPVPDRFI